MTARESNRHAGGSDAAARRASIAGSATQGVLRDLLEGSGTAYSRDVPPHEPTLLGRIASVVLIAILVTGSIWAARDLQRTRAGAHAANQELIEQVRDRSAMVEALSGEIASLGGSIASQQESIAPEDPSLADYAELLGVRAGAAPVVGPGLVITLDDDAVTDAEGRVRDVDLQILVNALWSVGAEAIAINGERVSSATALRTAGQAILVNLVPLSPPYRVEAIGDAGDLQVGLAQTRAAGHLAGLRESYGVDVSIARQDELQLPGAPLATTPRYATPIHTDDDGNLVG